MDPYNGAFTGQQIDNAIGMALRMSNQNLLDNWWFPAPVNQRGQAEYAANGYTIDRWNSVRVAVSLRDGYVGLTKTDTSAAGRFRQPIDQTFKAGTQLTFSILARVNSISGGRATLRFSKATAILGKYTPLVETAGKFQVFTCTLTLSEDIDDLWVEPMWLDAATAADISLVAAKLELGPTQTLAHQGADGNWVLNDPPPNKVLELLKCQKYQVFGGNIIGNYESTATNNRCFAFVPLGVRMRTKPTIIGDDIAIRTLSSNTEVSGATVEAVSVYENGVDCLISGVTEPCYFYTRNGGLDANLY